MPILYFPKIEDVTLLSLPGAPNQEEQLGHKTLTFPKDLAQIPLAEPAVQHKVQH